MPTWFVNGPLFELIQLEVHFFESSIREDEIRKLKSSPDKAEIQNLKEEVQRLKSSTEFRTEDEMEKLAEDIINQENKMAKIQMLLKQAKESENKVTN